jgi:hypothetical protein
LKIPRPFRNGTQCIVGKDHKVAIFTTTSIVTVSVDVAITVIIHRLQQIGVNMVARTSVVIPVTIIFFREWSAGRFVTLVVAGILQRRHLILLLLLFGSARDFRLPCCRLKEVMENKPVAECQILK